MTDLIRHIIGIALIVPAFCFLWTGAQLAGLSQFEWVEFRRTGIIPHD